MAKELKTIGMPSEGVEERLDVDVRVVGPWGMRKGIED